MKKRILFFGTPEIAVPALRFLKEMETIEIVGVGVPPEKPIGRAQILTKCPVKIAAEKLELPIFEVGKKSDLAEIFEKTNPDLAIVIAFGVIFPEEILERPKFGTINVHFSLLPKFRGASPVQSAILAGEKVSGISFQKMVKKLDAGDVLFSQKFSIENQSTSELWKFFAEETAHALPNFLDNFFAGKITPRPQIENVATHCKKFEKSAGEIFPARETANEIWQKFLAFDAWPGIFLKTKKGNLKILELSKTTEKNTVEIACSDGEIFLKMGQLPGKNPAPIVDILRGNPNLFL
ncbi:methionyl-tRNA formyltransferase [bacterium]|jgi:methionyl-tRNA formyltransferase|nr:methionyl-tRNA formyltransferase [bacterium]MBT6832417.1 methionyl-tRNA formyltransferase [bacterium]MBT6996088.1 methionyl-tRNA formyltransferase [bacterium]MBT7772537.1 methionyl-tRNA formyltransferase [bacterium]